MFLSTLGLDSIDYYYPCSHQQTPVRAADTDTLAGCMHHRGNTHAPQMPDLTASTAPTDIGISAWGNSTLFPHDGSMEPQFFPFQALQMVPASPDRAESCACGGRCNPPHPPQLEFVFSGWVKVRFCSAPRGWNTLGGQGFEGFCICHNKRLADWVFTNIRISTCALSQDLGAPYQSSRGYSKVMYDRDNAATPSTGPHARVPQANSISALPLCINPLVGIYQDSPPGPPPPPSPIRWAMYNHVQAWKTPGLSGAEQSLDQVSDADLKCHGRQFGYLVQSSLSGLLAMTLLVSARNGAFWLLVEIHIHSMAA